MSSLWFNIRVGAFFFQIRGSTPHFLFFKSAYWAHGVWREDPFCVYVFFGRHR